MTTIDIAPFLPFPDFQKATSSNSIHATIEQRKGKMLNLFMLKEVKLVGAYNMPQINPYNKDVPNVFITSHEARSFKRHDVGILFYEDDYQFDRLWNEPIKSTEFLKQFRCIVGPDYSQFLNMPYAARIWNNFRNKMLMAWMQKQGMNVIPNVTWSDTDSFEYCFDGLPTGSVISINSLGMQSNSDSYYFWKRGYEEAIARLEPSRIIRYGQKMDGECESISTYITNRHKNREGYGR